MFCLTFVYSFLYFICARNLLCVYRIVYKVCCFAPHKLSMINYSPRTRRSFWNPQKQSELVVAETETMRFVGASFRLTAFAPHNPRSPPDAKFSVQRVQAALWSHASDNWLEAVAKKAMHRKSTLILPKRDHGYLKVSKEVSQRYSEWSNELTTELCWWGNH